MLIFLCNPVLLPVEDHTYTQLVGPVAWMAPETFAGRAKGQVVSAASDVYMLGSCFLEVMSGCQRTPFDWLTGYTLLAFRGQESTRQVNTLQVGAARACSEGRTALSSRVVTVARLGSTGTLVTRC